MLRTRTVEGTRGGWEWDVVYGGEPGVLGKISRGVCGLPKESFRNSVFFKDLNTCCWNWEVAHLSSWELF